MISQQKILKSPHLAYLILAQLFLPLNNSQELDSYIILVNTLVLPTLNSTTPRSPGKIILNKLQLAITTDIYLLSRSYLPSMRRLCYKESKRNSFSFMEIIGTQVINKFNL